MAKRVDEKWPWPSPSGGIHGTFPDELKALQRLEKNPAASPLADTAPARLLAPKRTSDDLRFGEPARVESDEGPGGLFPLSHVVLRRLRLKRARAGWRAFAQAVDAEALDDLPGNRREQMQGMRRREEAMLDLIERYNGLAETVYAQLLSESKG